jgi:hypothetical protein
MCVCVCVCVCVRARVAEDQTQGLAGILPLSYISRSMAIKKKKNQKCHRCDLIDITTIFIFAHYSEPLSTQTKQNQFNCLVFTFECIQVFVMIPFYACVTFQWVAIS